MKFENKNVKLQITENENANYAKLVLLLYKQASTEGLTLDQMRKDIKIMDLFEANIEIETFELSNDLIPSIQKLVSKSVWPIRHIDLVEFADYIEGLSKE